MPEDGWSAKVASEKRMCVIWEEMRGGRGTDTRGLVQVEVADRVKEWGLLKNNHLQLRLERLSFPQVIP